MQKRSYKRRRRRRARYGLRRKIGNFFGGVAYGVKAFFSWVGTVLLPPRAPGEPLWKSRRLIAGAVAGLLCVGLVVLILTGGGKKSEAAAPVSADVDAAEEPAPQELVRNLYNGCPDDIDVSLLQDRLVIIGYMEDDEGSNHFDAAMDEAVRRFQLVNETGEVDGRVDNALWEKIFSDDYKPYILMPGMNGEDIKELQKRLRDLGYLAAKPTGYYGTDTDAALRSFQEKNGLTVSGVIDEATAEKLYADDVISLFFKVGDRSDEVKELQQRLKDLGYITFTPDGEYGNGTKAAVRQFQMKNDLVIDGYVGYDTKSALFSNNAKKNVLSNGDEGTQVEKLQNRLVKLGYINKATGYFGTDTAKAVKNFQKQHSLSADGMAGAKTLSVLYSDSAQKAKTKVVVGSSSRINNLISAAKSRLGRPYVRGAKGPGKFDCSGLVYWCLRQVGVPQGYMTSVTWRKAGNYKTIKNINDVRAGDIICYSPHHVAIAISSDTMIDASSRNRKVVQRSFKTAYWKSAFVCARRIF